LIKKLGGIEPGSSGQSRLTSCLFESNGQHLVVVGDLIRAASLQLNQRT
jgi:hypothetical protein